MNVSVGMGVSVGSALGVPVAASTVAVGGGVEVACSVAGAQAETNMKISKMILSIFT
jgi:hypothetical protein